MGNSAAGNQDHPSEPGSISSTLLERVKANRPEAWARLADLYGPVVYRWCRQSGVTRDDAPDVVQEVFAALALHVGGFRRETPGDSFAAWLRTITQNKVRDHFRSRLGRPAAEGGTEAQQRLQQLAEPSEPSEAGSPRDVQEMVLPIGLDLVRAEFEPRTWDAFHRVVIQRQPPVRVANELGMSIQAVYQAKSRVLRRLRQDLDGTSIKG
jgi:RNA polymerase sigma-70 factor (ECF subfamily)